MGKTERKRKFKLHKSAPKIKSKEEMKAENEKSFNVAVLENLEEELDNKKLSRGQKKRRLRREKLMGRIVFAQEALKPQHKPLQTLSSIGEFLPLQLDTPKPCGPKKRSKRESRKSSQRNIVDEIARLHAVVEHPQFQKDPFQAIQTHLQNVL